MPCYRPITAFKPADGGAISFVERKDHREVKISCGQCIGCRIEKQEAWAFRCYAESKMHVHKHFLTLTYDDEHLPPFQSLTHRDWQLFAKLLRKRLGSFRFFMCGEYGENTHRPHYHALLFGVDIPDLVKSNSVCASADVYNSAIVRDCWKKGNISIGSVTWQSARYCASYALKKDSRADRYEVVDTRTGELGFRLPEYARMSLKPGIGAEWIAKYYPEVLTHGGVHVHNRKVKMPVYFRNYLKEAHAVEEESMSFALFEKAQDFIDDRSPARLEVRENVAKAKCKFDKERFNHAL